MNPVKRDESETRIVSAAWLRATKVRMCMLWREKERERERGKSSCCATFCAIVNLAEVVALGSTGLFSAAQLLCARNA